MKLEEVTNQVVLAEKLGFSRYWIGEHHFSQKTLAWSNPQAVLPLLASQTKRIRIGSAGVLLNIYSPYNVATFFKQLNNLFNNRIDLGVANGAPGKEVIKYATGMDSFEMSSHFQKKINELVYYLREEDELYNDGNGVVIPPYKGIVPEIWSLSSSAYRSANRIVNLKLNLSRSLFHNNSESDYARDTLIQLREEYFARHNTYPNINLSVSVICHRSMKSAQRVASQLPGSDHVFNIVGSPNYFYDKIAEMKENYGVNEFMLYINAFYEEDRYLALQLISKVLNLKSSLACVPSI